MGFSQKPKLAESDKGSVENAALIALQSEFDDFKKQSILQKQILIEEKECAFTSLKEFLLNQAREVEQVQNKVAGMKARVTSFESGSPGESDIHARLRLVEQSLSDLRQKYNERAKRVERATVEVASAEDDASEDDSQAESIKDIVKDIDPNVLRSEIATLQNLQVIVSNFYSQLFASKTEADYQLEVAVAYEKLASAEKQNAASRQALADLRTEYEGKLDSAASGRKHLLQEKEDTYASLKQVILLQLREAQAVNSKLSQLKERMSTDDESESAGFGEMKVRLKLTETALLALLKEHEEKGKVIEEARSSSNQKKLDDIDFSSSFAKVRRLREVLGYVHGQLKAAEASNEEKFEGVMRTLRDENAAYEKEVADLRNMIHEGKQEKLQEKEYSCECMAEVIRMKKQEVDQLRKQLTNISDMSQDGDASSTCSGLNEMETRLNLVDKALSQIGEEYEEATRKLTAYRTQSVEDEEKQDDIPHVPDFKTNHGKVQNLGRILGIIHSQLESTDCDEGSVQRTGEEEKQEADEKLHAMRQHFQAEKETAFACLTEVIALKEGEAQLIRTTINKLQGKENVGVEEMETRLKLVEVALGELRMECEEATRVIEEENQLDSEDDHEVQPSSAKKCLAKLNQLRGILCFLRAQLNAAMFEDDDRRPSKAEKASAKALESMREQLVSEKESACACLMDMLHCQENEVHLAHEKINTLKEQSDLGVDEMETRLRLVETAMGDLRLSCEEITVDLEEERTGEIETVKPSNALESLGKLNRLGGILSFLNSHLDAAILSATKPPPPQKNVVPAEKLDLMRQKFLSEKDHACSCLMDVIKVQEFEAGNARSKVNKLQECDVRVDEMDTRLKLVEVALTELRSGCEGTKNEIDGETYADPQVAKSSNAQESLAKLARLRGILSFLNSHLDAAILSATKPPPPQKNVVPAEKLDLMRQKFLSEKDHACSCLMDVIKVQEFEAGNARSKVNKLQECDVRVDEMDTRLKLVEVALTELRSGCEGTKNEIDGETYADPQVAKSSNAQESLAKLARLRGILSFLNSHLDAAILSATKPPPPQKNVVPAEKLDLMRQKFLSEKDHACSCLMDVIKVQEFEAGNARSKVNKLQECDVRVHEMDTRLKLVEVALTELRSGCEGTKNEIDGETYADPQVAKSSNAQESLAKLARLRGILSFLNSHLDAAIASEEKRRAPKKTAAEKAAEEKFHEMGEKFLGEKDSACTCLMEVIRVQEHDAQCLRNKVDQLKEGGKAGVNEMDTRLRLAEVALRDLRLECEESVEKGRTQSQNVDEPVQVSNTRNNLAKVNRLRGIICFLRAQLDAAVSDDAAPKKKSEVCSLTENEKSKIRECLSKIVSLQEETQPVRGKLSELKARKGDGIKEMETRFRLADTALSEIRDEFEGIVRAIEGKGDVTDANAITPAHVAQRDSKVNQLRGIIGFLSAQVNAAMPDDEVLDQEKKRAASVLAEIIVVQEEAELVQSKVNNLKNSSIGVEEMETRLKLAGSALSTLRSEFEGPQNPNANAGEAKLKQLRGLIGFLQAQVNSVTPEKSDVSESSEDECLKTVDRQEVLEERSNTSACLLELIRLQEVQAQLVRSKVTKLKEHGCGGVEELETRLRLAETGLSNLRSTAGEMATDPSQTSSRGSEDMKTTNSISARTMLGKLTQLRGIFGFLDAQSNAVLSEIASEKEANSRSKDRKTTTVYRPEDSLFRKMNDVLGSQYEEMVRLRLAVERKNSVTWATIIFLARTLFFGCMVTSMVYLVRGWESSMTPYNIMCSPALPGARITEQSGVHAAPFWVPTYFKSTVYESICRDVPQIRLEVKEGNFFITEVDTGATASTHVAPVEKIRRYPARFAYVTLSNILTFNSNGWHEVDLPWGDYDGRDEGDSGRLRLP